MPEGAARGKREPRPLRAAPSAELSRVRAVFFDIDDTFSGDGAGDARIRSEAFAALWRLREAGLHVVPVTGRPAGWCDHIARMWPVSAVVGENGAFYAYLAETKRGRRLVKKYLESAAVRAKNAARLRALERAIRKEFPGARVPSDQLYREFDLAIDYREDVPRWPAARVRRLLEFCRARGAVAKLSSIHVNTWYGRYDKWTCVRRVLEKLFGMRPQDDEEIRDVVYIGDSPNDEPFFERLPLTVGVANVREFLDGMDHVPAYVTDAGGGLGFAEFAASLLHYQGKVLGHERQRN